MAKKRQVTVVLTDAARQVYARDKLLLGLMAGESYFRCHSVVQNGSFLEMELGISPGKRELRFKLSIPVSAVLYTVSAADMDLKQLGFRDEPPETLE